MTETISPADTAAAPPPHLSEHVHGTSILDKIADGVNRFCGPAGAEPA
jgi:hypothetical protein